MGTEVPGLRSLQDLECTGNLNLHHSSHPGDDSDDCPVCDGSWEYCRGPSGRQIAALATEKQGHI